MNKINELLILKYSSELIVHQTQKDSYNIDHENIRRHSLSISDLQKNQTNLGIIIVTSAARKILGRDAWPDVTQAWSNYISNNVTEFQLTDEDFNDHSENIFNHINDGEVCIVNGNDSMLRPNSRLRNNDYVSAYLTGRAAMTGSFTAIELGMFTNVDGLFRDLGDQSSILPIIHDIDAAKKFVTKGHKPGTTGGMITKLDAAKLALRYGAKKVWIANGRANNALENARSGLIGTTILRDKLQQ